MEAFLPGSQIDNKKIKNLDDYVGKVCEFKILKINVDRRNVVVSRRELLEAERISKKAELIEQITIGERRKGIVKNITDFGVFLDLDGIDGLLHITDMTWKRIRHPSEMVELNQELEVIILSVDKEKGRVALGLKQKSIILGKILRRNILQENVFAEKLLNSFLMEHLLKSKKELKALFTFQRCLGLRTL